MRPDTPDGVVDSTVSEGIAYGICNSLLVKLNQIGTVSETTIFDNYDKYASYFVYSADGKTLQYVNAVLDNLGEAHVGLGEYRTAESELRRALHAADGPLHHAAVAGHAVLVVHDVVTRLEVVEEALGVAAAGARLKTDWLAAWIADPKSLQPGQELKVIRGKFSALIDLSEGKALKPARAARLIDFHARDAAMPSFREVPCGSRAEPACWFSRA